MSLDTTNSLPQAANVATGAPPYECAMLSIVDLTRPMSQANLDFYKSTDDSDLLVSVGWSGWMTGSVTTLALHARIDETDYAIVKRYLNATSVRVCLSGWRQIAGISAGSHKLQLWTSAPGFLTNTTLWGNVNMIDWLSISVLEVEE